MDKAESNAWRVRFTVPVVMVLVTHVFGTLGFWLTWGTDRASWFDALFMTFTTVTTIGYGEIHPLSTAGRLVAMGVAATGMASLFYLFTTTMEFMVNAQLRGRFGKRRMQSRIDMLKGHFIVAGLGRVGRQAASELHEAKVPFVALDTDIRAVDQAIERGEFGLYGDATTEESLKRAGIERAKGLIVTTESDATNLFVIMSARQLNPKLFIVSRAGDEATVAKLLRAGADRAMSPYAVGGRRLAHMMLSPRVVDFFETALKAGDRSLNIGDILVTQGMSAAGRTLAGLRAGQEAGATVLAVLRSGEVNASPRGDFTLATGDRLLALGTAEQLERLERLMET